MWHQNPKQQQQPPQNKLTFYFAFLYPFGDLVILGSTQGGTKPQRFHILVHDFQGICSRGRTEKSWKNMCLKESFSIPSSEMAFPGWGETRNATGNVAEDHEMDLTSCSPFRPMWAGLKRMELEEKSGMQDCSGVSHTQVYLLVFFPSLCPQKGPRILLRDLVTLARFWQAYKGSYIELGYRWTKCQARVRAMKKFHPVP